MSVRRPFIEKGNKLDQLDRMYQPTAWNVTYSFWPIWVFERWLDAFRLLELNFFWEDIQKLCNHFPFKSYKVCVFTKLLNSSTYPSRCNIFRRSNYCNNHHGGTVKPCRVELHVCVGFSKLSAFLLHAKDTSASPIGDVWLCLFDFVWWTREIAMFSCLSFFCMLREAAVHLQY